jgi:hypothetical protein
MCFGRKNPRLQEQMAKSHVKRGLFKADPKRITNQTDEETLGDRDSDVTKYANESLSCRTVLYSSLIEF